MPVVFCVPAYARVDSGEVVKYRGWDAVKVGGGYTIPARAILAS